MSIGTFEDPFTPIFGAAAAPLIKITYGSSSVLGQNNEQPPAVGNIQLVFPTSSGNPAPPQEFFEVGAEILKNVKGFIAASPDKAVQGMKKRIDKAISDVKKGGDLKKLNRLKRYKNLRKNLVKNQTLTEQIT